MTNEAPNFKLLTAGLLLGLILASLDQTIVSTAMPSIMEQLDGLSLYSWVFSVYLLTSTVSIPIYGKLADLYGRKKMYLMGLSLFLAGSLLCGLAGSMELLILFRAVQGLGAGALLPLAFTIVGDLYPPERRGPHLFKIRAIAAGNVTGFFMSAGMFGAIAYIPLFVQGIIGVSPSVTGYILTPLMLAVVVTTTFGGWLMGKWSCRMILIPSLALMAAGFLLLSRMDSETSLFQIVIYMVITGLGMGAVYPTIGTAAQSAVDFKFRGAATSSSQLFRSIGGTVGVSVLGSLLVQRMASGLNEMGGLTFLKDKQLQDFADPQLLMDAEVRSSLPEEVLSELQSLFSQSLNGVFFTGFLFVFIALIACLFMGDARLIRQ
ncbi:MDR family MFS transporter [Paenibacillus harenae]|uniref:MDR family MFS transporter n=1 Tax=Paenibacillus harenae TaxID=306543 RepID=UPI0003F7FEE6|nr:MDR family MFS transporter [Paenibacillus harenae]